MKYRPCCHALLLPDQCHYCKLATTNPKYAVWAKPLPAGVEPKKPDAKVAVQQAKQALQCVYFGERLGGSSCGGWLHRCNYDGVKCSKTNCKDAQRFCLSCPHVKTDNGLTPTFTHEFTGLVSNTHNTNCSLLPWQGKRLLAYRSGWSNARIHLAEVNEAWQVVADRRLVLRHPDAIGGQEDPRLFIHDGELYLAFVGVKHPQQITVARLLLAKLDDSFNASEIWEPALAWPELMEKNWQPFTWNGGLYAVYSCEPWRIVELRDGKAIPFLQAKGVTWDYGEIRGGSPPVLVGDEYYCFFHGTDKRKNQRDLASIYTAGVLTFDAKTLLPKRLSKKPILYPDWKPELRWHCRTAYVCGAYLRNGDEWVLSYGSNDHTCRVAGFSMKDVEGALEVLK